MCLSILLLELKSQVMLSIRDSSEIKLGNAELNMNNCGEIAFCEMPLACKMTLSHSENI